MKKHKIIFADERSDSHEEKSPKIPSPYLVLLFGYLLLLGYIAAVIDDDLPAVVTEQEAGNTSFSEERAQRYLRDIVGAGPRVTGTRYHLEKTLDMLDMVERVASEGVQQVYAQWQQVSGDYWLAYRRPHVNMYHNASNIIALIEGQSGFNADGASDNALFCAAMLETLGIMSKRNVRPLHNIIFLFNGAEETPLQASHGFTQHAWSKGVTALINLDSAGINCKSMLFQVTDPRVVALYARSVPSPSAHAFGEALFQMGIVPSDTDFRIFRDFGDIRGVDIAFSKVGHVYHTRHDSLEMLWPGVLQHSGDMLLALATELAGSDQFTTKVESSTSVYWDYLNVFMFAYSFRTANIVDSVIVIIAAASVLCYTWVVGIRWVIVRELLLAVVGRLLAAAAGVLALWVVTWLTVATTIQLRYLSHAWVVVPMYWLPFVIASVTVAQAFDAWRWNKCGLNRIRRVCQSMAATRAILLTLTIVLLMIGNTATLRYIMTVPLLAISVTAFVSLSVVKKFPLKAWQHIILEMALATPILLFLFVIAIKINTLMLPIMGRSPTSVPDYTVAALNMLVVVLAAMPLSGIELLFSRIRLWIVVLIFSVACLIVCFIPFSPYRESNSNPALQRHVWFHTEIITYNQEGVQTDHRTGIWFGRTEVNTPYNILNIAADKGIALNNVRTEFDQDCEAYSYCNVPMVTSRTVEHVDKSMWADFEPPSTPETPPQLTHNNRTCVGNLCTLSFAFIGPPQMSLVLWPRAAVSLVSWSLATPVTATLTQGGRPVYVVFYSRATYSEDVESVDFEVTFEVPNPTSSDPILDLAFNAHRRSHPEEFTDAYRQLSDAMPDYFNIATYLSSRYNYVF